MQSLGQFIDAARRKTMLVGATSVVAVLLLVVIVSAWLVRPFGVIVDYVNYVRTSVIVITDGYVSVESDVFQLIRKNLNQANVFAFGIGTSVNPISQQLAKLLFTGNERSHVRKLRELLYAVELDRTLRARRVCLTFISRWRPGATANAAPPLRPDTVCTSVLTNSHPSKPLAGESLAQPRSRVGSVLAHPASGCATRGVGHLQPEADAAVATRSADRSPSQVELGSALRSRHMHIGLGAVPRAALPLNHAIARDRMSCVWAASHTSSGGTIRVPGGESGRCTASCAVNSATFTGRTGLSRCGIMSCS